LNNLLSALVLPDFTTNTALKKLFEELFCIITFDDVFGDVTLTKTGQILSVAQYSLTAWRWLPDGEHHSDNLFLPPYFVALSEDVVIQIPSISSLVLMATYDDIIQFKIHYVHGMKKVLCTRQRDVVFHYPLQSLMLIIFEGIPRISIELQRVL